MDMLAHLFLDQQSPYYKNQHSKYQDAQLIQQLIRSAQKLDPINHFVTPNLLSYLVDVH